MRFGVERRYKLMALGLAAGALLSIAACERTGGTSSDSPPAAPVPTRADPRNVMPPGGPYAWVGDAQGTRDRDLTAKVRLALRAESAVDGLDIAVTSVKGKVLLSGALPQEQIPRAVEVARAVDGVREVDNRLAATG
ncbi:MAG TPA: BON domain-containing protein [Burkholderiales bacterium]|jgi:hypothetical protein